MGRPKSNYFFGLDLGNGAIKVVGENFEERIPSIQVETHSSDELGHVSLDGRSFVVGKAAQYSLHAIPTVDDRSIKIEGIDRLYFGALAYLPAIPSIFKSYCVASSHAWKTHKEAIKEKLEGTREVTLAGKPCEVTTECLAVVPEGFGAIADKSNERIATLDFGTGTTLITPYINKKPLDSVQAQNGGVHNLYLMVADGMRQTNHGYVGNVREIRRSLEAGHYDVSGCDIKALYQEQLKIWWNERLADVRNEALKLQREGFEILCVGGGVALPGFSKLLKSKKFEFETDKPELASARGLYRLALAQGKKKGILTSEVAA